MGKGWLQCEGSVVAKIESTEEICAGVTLFEFKKDAIIERFDGAGDKQAASARKRGESVGVTEKVFDFDGDVVGEMRMLCVEHFDNSRGVSNAIEKIGSPNVMCSAPAWTCWRMSARTISCGTTRNCPA